MYAIVAVQLPDGSFPTAGGSHQALSSSYKSKRSFIRYFAIPYARGKPFRVEVFQSHEHCISGKQGTFSYHLPCGMEVPLSSLIKG